MSGQRRVASFGEALIDMLARPPENAGGVRSFLQFAGGAPANVSVAVARLGGQSLFVGMLGRDMFGDFLLQSLEDAGVHTDGVVRTDEAGTALAFVALDANGERSFSFYRPPSADLLFRIPHFDQVRFETVSVFHVCSVSMTGDEIAQVTFEGMRRSRAAGAIVSFDMNLRPMLWPRGLDPAPRLWEALRLADVVKLSREEFDWLCATSGGDRAGVIERLWQGHAQLLLITDGANSVRWHTRRGSGEVPVFRVEVLDSTAAGDAFVGGFLHRLAQQLDRGVALESFCADLDVLQGSLRFAAAAGALAVTKRGSFAAMPTDAAVLRLMEEQSTCSVMD
jgi:fructokinase